MAVTCSLATAGEELPVQQQGLLMELMANLAGSFAACLACGGAQADLMSDDLQGETNVALDQKHPIQLYR